MMAPQSNTGWWCESKESQMSFYLVEKQAMDDTFKKLADLPWSEANPLIQRLQQSTSLLPEDEYDVLKKAQEEKATAVVNGEPAKK